MAAVAGDPQTSSQAVVDAIYDLRDHSYDNPELWKGVDLVSVSEVMGQIIDRAIDSREDMDWTNFPTLVQDALVGAGRTQQ
jgi:hypothetical protein